MTLPAVSTNYPDRIAGAIDSVGVATLSFLETTESYRRDLRRVEYGDERDPKMREFLHSISPVTNATRSKNRRWWCRQNDPRVPYTEAEQIVAKARQWSMVSVSARAEKRRPRLTHRIRERRLLLLRDGALHAGNDPEERAAGGARPRLTRCPGRQLRSDAAPSHGWAIGLAGLG